MAGVLIHVQHLLGSGHLHRCMRISDQLSALGIDVTICSGGRASSVVTANPRVKLVQLEAIHSPPDFSRLLDDQQRDVDERLWQLRQRQLMQALGECEPEIALIESFPFARRLFRIELLPLLQALRQRSVPAFCSIRDILQPKHKPGRVAETLQLLNENFAGVLVHGDPRVAELGNSFAAARDIEVPVTYTGYVSSDVTEEASPAGTDEVLVSAGGGAVGAALLEAAMSLCSSGMLANNQWRFLVGQAAPAPQRQRLQQLAPDNALVTEATPAFPSMLRRCALSISQAGYNTMVDVLAAGCPAVAIPYTAHGEREQEIRADRLHALGLVTRCQNASAAELRTAIEACLARERPRVDVDLGGAQQTARWLADQISQLA